MPDWAEVDIRAGFHGKRAATSGDVQSQRFAGSGKKGACDSQTVQFLTDVNRWLPGYGRGNVEEA